MAERLISLQKFKFYYYEKIKLAYPAIAVFLVILMYPVISRNSRKKYESDLSSVIGCRMLLPPEMDRDNSHSATLVIYYDTITCISCMMNRLGEWNELFSELKDSHGFTPLFIFEPSIQDSAEYRQKLDHAKLTYQVFSDYHRTFRRSNPDIADNSSLKTFLLDRQHRVVFAGNPLHNMVLWEVLQMYISVLLENDGTLPDRFPEKVHDYIATRTRPQNGLLFDTFQTDVGNVRNGSTQTVTFTALNTTKSAVEIAGILTDCDCVQADASTYSITPGRTCIITVSFAPEDIGHFEHHVFIQTAGCSDETHLIITGNSISFG